VESGFELAEPATVVSTGVSMYLSKETNLETFRKVAQLTKGTVFAMTFLLKLELLSALERALMQFVMQKAEEGGTPFLSLFAPEEVLEMAREAGLKAARCEPAESLFNRYLARRGDELKMGEAEAFLVAQV
jgi:O-methyltransferase involved in polyketide biosynthesis